MKRILSIIIISLCSILAIHAQTTIYMHEVSTVELGPETQYTPRHARSANIVPFVEACDNIYYVTLYNDKENDYEIYFTDDNHVILYYQKGSIDDNWLKVTIPDIIKNSVKIVTLKINNKTYIGYKQ